nr:serine/threonine protein kinase SRPK1 [Tanacetum cinerariifolium]
MVEILESESEELEREMVEGKFDLANENTRFGVNHKMTNAVPAPPTDPPNTQTDTAYGGLLKALDEGFSSKNYVKKFFRALHPKWRAKVIAIKESKDLSSLALDDLIGNLKVHEVVMEKDSKIYRDKKERIKSIALKAKK